MFFFALRAWPKRYRPCQESPVPCYVCAAFGMPREKLDFFNSFPGQRRHSAAVAHPSVRTFGTCACRLDESARNRREQRCGPNPLTGRSHKLHEFSRLLAAPKRHKLVPRPAAYFTDGCGHRFKALRISPVRRIAEIDGLLMRRHFPYGVGDQTERDDETHTRDRRRQGHCRVAEI